MKIIGMRLENFQGLKFMEFGLNGRNADIFGDNATGKTTVYNAFTWLLFGKSSTGAEGFTPKTKSPDGEAHNLDHGVEMTIEIGAGAVTLRRVYREVWKKARGHNTAEFSGHTTEYFINGVPKKDKEYTAYVDSLIGSTERARLLTSPFYFSETLNWRGRRDILLNMCGGQSDVDIIAARDELRPLAALITGTNVDELKKGAKAQQATINKQLQALPARIDEAQKAIPDTGTHTPESIETALAGAEKELKTAAAKREQLHIQPINRTAEQQVSGLLAALNAARIEHDKNNDEILNAAKDKIHACRRASEHAEADVFHACREAATISHNIGNITRRRAAIKEEIAQLQAVYETTLAVKFDTAENVCAACGQLLPADKIAEITEKFNIDKSNKLQNLSAQIEALVKQGAKEASKEMLAAAEQNEVAASAAVEVANSAASAAVEAYRAAQKELNNIALEAFEATENYRGIQDKIAAIRTAAATGRAVDTTEVDNKIAAAKTIIAHLQGVAADLKTAEQQRARITDLAEQEKRLGAAYEEQEKIVYLCDKFIRTKSDLLTDAINSRFKSVRFKLFRENITNDGIEDVCEVMVPAPDGSLVPYGIANNAGRINAGLEIIKTLSEYYGIALPVFVDNAESITQLEDIDAQLIRLIVSEPDKKLRLELR